MNYSKFSESHEIRLAEYGMSAEALQKALILHYEKGEYLCHQDTEMEYVLFLICGEAKVNLYVSNGKSLLLCFYKSGGVLGDMEMLLEKKVATDVIAISSVDCIGIPVDACKKELTYNTIFLRRIATELAGKLERCSRYSALNLLHTLENRLCAYIAVISNEGKFKENLTELAELLGTSYRHLLRTMDTLCKEGILEKYARTEYQVKDELKLKEKAKDCLMF